MSNDTLAIVTFPANPPDRNMVRSTIEMAEATLVKNPTDLKKVLVAVAPNDVDKTRSLISTLPSEYISMADVVPLDIMADRDIAVERFREIFKDANERGFKNIVVGIGAAFCPVHNPLAFLMLPLVTSYIESIIKEAKRVVPDINVKCAAPAA